MKSYNAEVKLFEETFEMHLDCNLYLVFNIKIETYVDGEKVTKTYTSNIPVDLGKKTTEITGILSDTDTGSVDRQITSIKTSNVLTTVIYIIMLLFGLGIIKNILSNTVVSRNIRSTYKLELNKILRNCQDRIIQVNEPLDVNNTDLIEVPDFQEIIKLSEELVKPILYWNSKQKEESWFAVISNNLTYLYKLTS